MKKITIKSHKIKSKIDFTKYFNQMLGLEDVPGEFISQKYEDLVKICQDFIKIWKIVADSDLVNKKIKSEFQVAFAQIHGFIESANIELKSFIIEEETQQKTAEFKSSLEEKLFEMAGKYDNKKLNIAYKELKKSKLVEHILVTYERLKSILAEQKKRVGSIIGCLDDPQNLQNTFITETDLDTKFLSFSNLDFKFMYSCFPDFETDIDKLFLLALRISYMRGIDTYKIYISPDIDVEKFCETFLGKIDELKKTIHGCDAAFSAIKKSIKLLKNNFEEYYKKFVTSKNPGVIFEGFLADVAEQNKNNGKISRELGKIVKEIKNLLMKNKNVSKDAEKLWTFADSIIDKLNT